MTFHYIYGLISFSTFIKESSIDSILTQRPILAEVLRIKHEGMISSKHLCQNPTSQGSQTTGRKAVGKNVKTIGGCGGR